MLSQLLTVEVPSECQNCLQIVRWAFERPQSTTIVQQMSRVQAVAAYHQETWLLTEHYESQAPVAAHGDRITGPINLHVSRLDHFGESAAVI